MLGGKRAAEALSGILSTSRYNCAALARDGNRCPRPRLARCCLSLTVLRPDGREWATPTPVGLLTKAAINAVLEGLALAVTIHRIWCLCC